MREFVQTSGAILFDPKAQFKTIIAFSSIIIVLPRNEFLSMASLIRLKNLRYITGTPDQNYETKRAITFEFISFTQYFNRKYLLLYSTDKTD